MTTPGDGTSFLVVRAWRQPTGLLCARIASAPLATEPVAWQVCVGIPPTLGVVEAWLQRVRLDEPAAVPHP